jgi:xylan 1,4-beta-xylosidase
MKSELARIFALAALLALSAVATRPQEANVLVVDASAPAHPFPHFWERAFGSGRAVLSLRESYRRDLRAVKQITGLEYVRFHAVFHNEVGIYDEEASRSRQERPKP